MGIFSNLFSSGSVDRQSDDAGFYGGNRIGIADYARADGSLGAELVAIKNDLQNYFDEIGVHNLSVPDIGYSETPEEIAAKRSELLQLRNKVEHYIEIGGSPSALYDSNYPEVINRVEYLSSIGCVDRQIDFVGMTCKEAATEIDAEESDFVYMRAKLDSCTTFQSAEMNNLQMSGARFESLCCSLVEKMGFEAEATKASGDGGIDIVAVSHLPFVSGKYVIQCKRYAGNVGEPVIRDLYGVVSAENANKGILMTTGGFTSSASAFAEGKQIELIDGNSLDNLLQQFGLAYIDNEEHAAGFDGSFELLLGAYYEDYVDACADADLIIRECKIVDSLFNAASVLLANGRKTVGDLIPVIRELDSHVNRILGAKELRSRRGRSIYYLTLLIKAQYCIWTCNLAKAAVLYQLVASEWNDIKVDYYDEPSTDVAWLALSSMAALNAIGMHIQAEVVRNKFSKWINVLRASAIEGLSDSDRMAISNELLAAEERNTRPGIQNTTTILLSHGYCASMGEGTDLVCFSDVKRSMPDNLSFGFHSFFVDESENELRISFGFGTESRDGKSFALTHSLSEVRQRESKLYRMGEKAVLAAPLSLLAP